MIPRIPPPAPHLHAANLPHPQGPPVRQNHSQGETEISYTAYSPSPSSLSNHRYKWARIRDWRSHNPEPPVRHLGSIGSHHPSVGVGSANWSDSGTGLDEGQTDIGTIPTTVRVDRELRDSTIVPDKRDRVDPIRAMGSHHSRRAQRDGDGGPSELPYRQNSQRRDARPGADDTGLKHSTRPINPSQRYDPTGLRSAPNVPPAAAAAQRPPLVHSSSRSKPTPHLARPPAAQPAHSPIQILPAGSPLVTSPESDGKVGGKNSPFAIREAYLNSALTLPLDMLAQTEKAKPPQVAELKQAKSQSSISSGLTIGRLGSLLGNSRGPSPNGGMKRVVSDSQAIRPPRANTTAKTNGTVPKAPLIERGGAIEEPANPTAEVRQAGSNSSSRTARPAPRTQEPPQRSLGSAGQLGRSATVPNNARLPSVLPPRTRPQEQSALGLDLGSPAITVTRPSDPPLPLEPIAIVPLQPAPHRQVTALRRPALTPMNSTDNLAKTLALGRKSRDPSMTDLRTRFEPATYPLPESKSSASATKSQTSGSGPASGKSKGDEKVPTMTSIRAKNKLEEVDPARLAGSQASKKKDKTNAAAPEALPLGVPDVVPAPVLPLPLQPAPPAVPVPMPVVQPVPIVPPPPPMLVPPVVEHLAAPPIMHEPMAPNGIPTPMPGPASAHVEQSVTSQTQDSSLLSPHPAVNTTRRSPKGHRVDRIREDDDRVSFEVPNGARGRLRVSLAWFRDHGRSRTDRTQTPSETPPPPVPPKPKRVSSGLRRPPIMPDPMSSTDTPDQISPPRRRPSPRPMFRDPTPQRHSPVRSPVNLDHTQRVYPPIDPYRPHATVPAYRPTPTPTPAIPAFQVNHPFAYPQPHPWASHPRFVPPHVQIQPPQAQGSRRPPSMESIDPPSGGGTPPAPPRMLSGMMGPMGMQSNMLHPFSAQSLHPAGMPQSPNRVGFGGAGGSAYSRPQQPIWKRMFNNRQNGWANGGMDYGMDEDHDGIYGRQPQRGGFGNDKIGKWMRGVTPGRAPPPRSQAPGTVAGGMFGGGGKRDYTLTQPFFRRQDRAGLFNGQANGSGNPYGPRRDANDYADHLDMLDRQPRRSAFLPRQGGMFDRMFTPANRQQRQRQQGGMWSTNQPRQTTAYDARDRYKEARRRDKIDRRNARAQAQAQGRFLNRTNTQQQDQQGYGRGVVRDWVRRLGNPSGGRGNGLTNGYGPQPQGMGRKLSRGPTGSGRWKDRLPQGNTGRRGQRGGGGGGGGNGLGLMGIGRAFRR